MSKSMTDIFISLPIISFFLWGIYDIWGFLKYGQDFIPYTISVRIAEINKVSNGSLGALTCLVVGILLCHLFFK